MVRFGAFGDKLFDTSLHALKILVAHCVSANIQGQADRLGCILHVAASLHDVLWCDVKCCRTVLLLEAP